MKPFLVRHSILLGFKPRSSVASQGVFQADILIQNNKYLVVYKLVNICNYIFIYGNFNKTLEKSLNPNPVYTVQASLFASGPSVPDFPSQRKQKCMCFLLFSICSCLNAALTYSRLCVVRTSFC